MNLPGQAAQGDHFVARITPDPIHAEPFLSMLQEAEGGAVNLFLGVTRRFTGGRETELLSYEAAEDLAIHEMNRLWNDARQKWPLLRGVIVHRIGIVPVGEASVLIGVATAHRKASFSAGQFLIDELKRRVPVWKKETYADGTQEWVEGTVPSADAQSRRKDENRNG